MTLSFQEAQIIAASWPGLRIAYAPGYCPFQRSKKRYVLGFAQRGKMVGAGGEDGESRRTVNPFSSGSVSSNLTPPTSFHSSLT